MKFENYKKYLDYVMKRFYPIGADDKGGVTRLAYTKEEDLMHEEFARIGQEEEYTVNIDEVGNTFLSICDYKEYYLVGSHLDSVINGGRFDGVAGVAAGLLLLKVIKENKLNIPLKVVALRCEESSNFLKSTFGSILITGEYDPDDFLNLKSRDGKNLGDVFKERGYSQTPKIIEGVKNYLELHIEQGRVLESENLNIGVVTSIAGNRRLRVTLKGMAEHSGATPMNIRKDALCGAAEIILGIERIVKADESVSAVATVGSLNNFPNSMNVVPGEVEFTIDIRDVYNDSMLRIRNNLTEMIGSVSSSRELVYEIKELPSSVAVDMDSEVIQGLSNKAEELGIEFKLMPSGAGHDAMKFAKITKSGMIFIPCKDGVSHNPMEHAETSDIAIAADIMLEYLKLNQLIIDEE